MRKIYFFIIINAIFSTFCISIKGQRDTLINVNTSTINIKKDNKLNKKYEYLNVNLKEEKSLFKLGISNLRIHSSKAYPIITNFKGSLSYERKLLPSLSVTLDNNLFYRYSDTDYHTGSLFSYSSDIGIRYYYSINKKIRESVGANNFHSNYLSVSLDRFLAYSDYYDYSRNMNSGWNYSPSVKLAWGMQRRIGNWGFVDLSPYVSYNQNYINFGTSLIFGLGLGR